MVENMLLEFDLICFNYLVLIFFIVYFLCVCIVVFIKIDVLSVMFFMYKYFFRNKVVVVGKVMNSLRC